MEISPNQLFLGKIEVVNGPYMQPILDSLVDKELTASRVKTILGDDFIDYLNACFSFVGWKLLQKVEIKSRYKGGPTWKLVHYVLDFKTDADVETVCRHLAEHTYQFDFRY